MIKNAQDFFLELIKPNVTQSGRSTSLSCDLIERKFMNQLQEAMSAVRTNSKSSKAWSDLGQALLEQKKLEKAKQSYQRALQLDPENEAAQQGIRMTLMPEQSVTEPETPPSSKKPASEKASPPPKAPPRKVEPEPQPKAKSKPVESRFSGEKDDEEDLADEPIRFSIERPNKVSAEKEKEKAIVFHDPPPPPEKPSPGRLWLGIFLMLLLPSLCLCGLFFAAYQLIS